MCKYLIHKYWIRSVYKFVFLSKISLCNSLTFQLQISALWSFGIYTSPFILTSLYRRDMFTPNGAVTISKFLVGVCVLYMVSMNIRALGRATNPTYREFLQTLNTALRDFNAENKKKIQLYDFEFSSWPVEFSMKGR